jgi:hypothetical protein
LLRAFISRAFFAEYSFFKFLLATSDFLYMYLTSICFLARASRFRTMFCSRPISPLARVFGTREPYSFRLNLFTAPVKRIHLSSFHRNF